MNGINWSQIKNGFRGFEQLAFDYVKCAFPSERHNATWKKTKETRDGNKDAHSIILGFRPSGLSEEEWWMEAKYSEKRNVLPRYRLDATVISAAIQGNVSKVIFVTNISISTKSMMDIRLTLKRTLNCGEVHFCTKNTLEHWLITHEAYFRKYFPSEDRTIIELEPLFLSEGIDFFSSIKHNQAFSEPLKILRKGEQYYLYFSVFSSDKKEASLKIFPELTGIKIISSPLLELVEGENTCCAKIEIEPAFALKYTLPDHSIEQKKDYLDGCIFLLEGTEILTKNSLSVLNATIPSMKIDSQKQLLTKLVMQYRSFTEKQACTYISIDGNSGVGKTFILEEFIHQKITPSDNFTSIQFTDDHFRNQKLICHILSFILFPYLPTGSIDSEYLEQLHVASPLDDTLKKLLISKDPDFINHVFGNTSHTQELFPTQMKINERVILLDDVQKLEPNALAFLYSVLIELYNKKQPIFLIVTGWSEFKKTQPYVRFVSNVCLINQSLRLTANDLIQALTSHNILDVGIDAHVVTHAFSSVIELLQFVQYCQDIHIENTEELLFSVNLFLNSDLATEYILSTFLSLFRTHPELRPICDAIYWSLNGKAILSSVTDVERLLIECEVARLSDDGIAIIPFHDRYQQIYRCKFLRPKYLVLKESDDFLNDLQNVLLYSADQMALTKCLEQIDQMKQKGSFFTLLYLLEPVFKDSELTLLRQKLGEYNYFKLYLAYGFGVANQSRSKSGKAIFQAICKESKSATDLQTKRIRVEAIFELINSDFEWLQYDSSQENISELLNLVFQLHNFDMLTQDLYEYDKYVLALATTHYIAAELETVGAEEAFSKFYQELEMRPLVYEAMFIRLRYGQTQYLKNAQKGLEIAKEAMCAIKQLRGETDKFYLWSKMDAAFLEFTMTKEPRKILEIQQTHELLRENFYNDYRKRTFSVACCYFSIGMVEEGIHYLFSEVTHSRELRPRQKGFFYQTLAIYELFRGHTCEAVAALRKAAVIFEHIPSYMNIIAHNQNVIQNDSFDQTRLVFCAQKQQFDLQFYYIDPRCIW